jgi:hypothetical protein
MGTVEGIRVSVQLSWAKPIKKHTPNQLNASILMQGATITHHGDYL